LETKIFLIKECILPLGLKAFQRVKKAISYRWL